MWPLPRGVIDCCFSHTHRATEMILLPSSGKTQSYHFSLEIELLSQLPLYKFSQFSQSEIHMG